jgi:4-oxalocrotonate tautomerase
VQLKKNTFFLDIKIVDGTNTTPKLGWNFEAILPELSVTLAGVHIETYASVHEVPAAACGFGGKAHEFRFIAGRVVAANELAARP